MPPRLLRAAALVLVPCMISLSLLSPARAALIDTGAATAPEPERARVLEALQRDDVRAQLVALGVSPDEALARVRAATPAELAALGRADSAPAGSGVFGVLVFVAAVLLLTELFGITRIFDIKR